MANKLALITGASAGLGAEFAKQLAKKNFDLILVARDKARLEELSRSLSGVQCEIYQADLTKPDELKKLEARVASGQALDLLVNNAGMGTFGDFYTLDIEKEEEEIRLNVISLVRLTRAALPNMIAIGKGAIINVSSIAGFIPGPKNVTYNATKAYVNSFTEGIYEELQGTGVRIMALCPGFTRTEFQDRAKIDVSGVPNAMWMNSDEVIEEALYGIERGELFCIPGAKNRAMLGLTNLTPRAITRKIAGFITRNFNKSNA
jgi:short-subunit dehydrogenase